MATIDTAHPETLKLEPDHQRLVLRHTADAIRAAVVGQPAPATPVSLASIVVSGSFVSLKRGKHLRSCCGGLQPRPSTLGEVLPEAVHRTVFDDPRFPPVSPAELPYLDLEVWLLFNPRRIAERGEARADVVVTGGKHGLVVRWGEQRGLLLPGVAAEQGWDARTFLDHVCNKAGLHPSRWKDDDTTLLTFEGVHFRDRVTDDETLDTPRFLSQQMLDAYTKFFRYNLSAFVFGGTPRYGAPGLPDGTISGLVLSLDLGADARPLQFSKLDLQRGMALQASLFQLTQAAAPTLAQAGVSQADVDRADLTILYDPTLHGSVADPDVRGIKAERRAVVVLDRGRSSMLYDSNKTPADTLAEAAALLPVREPATAGVFSLAADTLQARFSHVVRPRPAMGQSVRPAAVANAFYPGDAAALSTLIDELLGAEQATASWPAAMVPHAGLRFSGKIAASVFRRLKFPSTIIIIGPKHTPYGMDWAVAPQQEWMIPGARLASDPALAKQLTDAVDGLVLDAAAHQQEHGIEVELPFLARLAPKSRVVGIAIGPATLEDCGKIADGLAKVIRELPEPPLLLISSDMNHFANDAQTRVLDEMALTCLDRLDPAGLYETCKTNHISMCGVNPAVIVLETLKRLGRLKKSERVGYATSADATGETGRVVGYAGMLFG